MIWSLFALTFFILKIMVKWRHSTVGKGREAVPQKNIQTLLLFYVLACSERNCNNSKAILFKQLIKVSSRHFCWISDCETLWLTHCSSPTFQDPSSQKELQVMDESQHLLYFRSHLQALRLFLVVIALRPCLSNALLIGKVIFTDSQSCHL